MSNILIIEDEASVARALKNVLLDSNQTYEIDTAEDGIIGVKTFQNKTYDLVLCDIKMPNQDGMKTLKQLQEIDSQVPVIMISAHGDSKTIVEAIHLGAFNYIEKPLDLDRLLTLTRNALDHKNLKVENIQLKQKVNKKYEIIGKSKEIEKIKTMIEKVAATNSRVLITGESGTGKELIAHQIHQKSHRGQKAMIEVNCAAIPSELIESELFGHTKGSFTGAHKDKIGKFQAAHESTLFLDEVGDMSLSAQAKVLRILQEGMVTPVGSSKSKNINVRMIAATNKDLQKEIEQGNFREDLYHRLSVIVIKVPSLNERSTDIPILIEHFVKILRLEQGLPKKTFSQEALDFLTHYHWTGNIRELKNVVERLLILGDKQISKQNVITFANK